MNIISALSVDAALAAHVPLVFSEERAKGFLEARGLASVSASSLSEHLPALRQLAALGSSVVQLGDVRDVAVTWSLLAGLAESQNKPRRFASRVGTDVLPSELALPLARALEMNISRGSNDVDLLAGGADVLVIDGRQSYGALSSALAAAAPYVNRFIAVPRTESFGLLSETVRSGGDVATAAASAGWDPMQEAAGTKAALFDFISSPSGLREWALSAHFANGGGLTLLRRIALPLPPAAAMP